MQETGAAAPEARMQRVLAHIDAHLDGTLTLDRLSAVAALSKFHFHRRFVAWTGLPPRQYVQAARIRQAAFLLAYRAATSIAEIAFDCGYQSPEAFARVFKRLTGQTPAAFRAAPDWHSWPERLPGSGGAAPFEDAAVSLVAFPETRLAAMAHEGPAATLGETIRRFIAWRRAMRLRPGASGTFNIFDPDPEQPEGYRLSLAAATRRALAPEAAGLAIRTIPAGPCARLRLIGSGDDLGPAIAFLRGDWLARSGMAAAGFPMFAQRLSLFPDVPEGQAVTDLYLPVAPAPQRRQ